MPEVAVTYPNTEQHVCLVCGLKTITAVDRGEGFAGYVATCSNCHTRRYGLALQSAMKKIGIAAEYIPQVQVK